MFDFHCKTWVALDSDPEDGLDFDVVGKTENLSNAAAMHKRNVRPRHRNKARRVTAATTQMVGYASILFVRLIIALYKLNLSLY